MKPGRSGTPTKIETQSSNTRESAMTHLRADARARTSSRHVRTLPMNSAWMVVMSEEQQGEGRRLGQAVQKQGEGGPEDVRDANPGSRRHCT